MWKRSLDIVVSLMGLLVFSPVLLPVMFFVWRQDGHSPLYVAERVGRNGVPFNMVKLRSMVVNADKAGVDSTGASDPRITAVGHFIRRYKLDELTQLWNVLRGDMSIVGPRPNVKREAALYTAVENELLSIRPGITDFSSIVFSDEGDILQDKPDPDVAYNQLIRPAKSSLGLFYIRHRGLCLDVQLCCLTAVAIISRKRALRGVAGRLKRLGAAESLVEIAMRKKPLIPQPPPGADKIVTSRG